MKIETTMFRDFHETIDGIEEQVATLVFTQNLRRFNDSAAIAGSMDMFASQLRSRLHGYHLLVKWSADDQVTNKQMIEVALRFLKTLDLEEHMVAGWTHGGCDEPKLSLIANRCPGYFGGKEPDGEWEVRTWPAWRYKGRIKKARREMEKAYGWQVSEKL